MEVGTSCPFESYLLAGSLVPLSTLVREFRVRTWFLPALVLGFTLIRQLVVARTRLLRLMIRIAPFRPCSAWRVWSRWLALVGRSLVAGLLRTQRILERLFFSREVRCVSRSLFLERAPVRWLRDRQESFSLPRKCMCPPTLLTSGPNVVVREGGAPRCLSLLVTLLSGRVASLVRPQVWLGVDTAMVRVRGERCPFL